MPELQLEDIRLIKEFLIVLVLDNPNEPANRSLSRNLFSVDEAWGMMKKLNVIIDKAESEELKS